MQNERYDYEEMEIDLFDLGKVLFSKWKLICIGMLCGLLFGLGITVIKSSDTIPTKEELLESLTDAERNNVEDLYQSYYVMNRRIDILRTLLYSNQINSLELNDSDRVMQRTYYAVSSPFRGMNYVASETMLDSENYIDLSNILYGDASHVSETSQRVVLNCITDTERKDLMQYNSDSSNNDSLNEVMVLTVVGPDKGKVEEASRYVEQIIAGKELSAGDPELKVSILKIDSQYSEDQSAIVRTLYSSFDTLSDSLYSAETQLNTLQTNYISKLSGNSKTYYSLLDGEEFTASPKKYKRNGAIGLFLGFAAVCGWFILKYLFDGKVKTASELSWLIKGDMPHQLNEDASSHVLVAEDIVIRLNQKNKKNLFIVANDQTANESPVKDTIAAIKEKFNGDIKIGDPSVSATDMRELSESDSVVMIVPLKQERRNKVNQIEQTCRGYNSEIVGVITH